MVKGLDSRVMEIPGIISNASLTEKPKTPSPFQEVISALSASSGLGPCSFSPEEFETGEFYDPTMENDDGSLRSERTQRCENRHEMVFVFSFLGEKLCGLCALCGSIFSFPGHAEAFDFPLPEFFPSFGAGEGGDSWD